MMGPNCWGWGGTFLGHPFGMVIGFLFWALIVYGLFVSISNIKRGSGPADKAETAMDILKRRYAGGEINQEEFSRIKKDLAN